MLLKHKSSITNKYYELNILIKVFYVPSKFKFMWKPKPHDNN